MDFRLPVLFLLPVIILISGCAGFGQNEAPATRIEINEVTMACVKACNEALKAGRDLSQGPCLSEQIITNWVCDVAHAPRTRVDNEQQNQCAAFGKTAKHFVEVDPQCNFIRAV